MADHLAPTDLPDTDDPVLLRERLQQAHEQLRLHQSIEQMMAERLARTEALLAEARSSHDGNGATIDTGTVRSVLRETRDALDYALRRLDHINVTNAGELQAGAPQSDENGATPSAESNTVVSSDEPHTIDVLVHNITSPAQARTLQQHLAAIDTVTSATVRELAEGMLRITVKAETQLTSEDLQGWEPDRGRTVRTERPDVLEVELAD